VYFVREEGEGVPFSSKESFFMRCACKHIKCDFKRVTGVFGQGVLVVFLVLVLSGCKRKETVKLEEVYSNRANDKGYIASLITNRQQQAQDSRSLFALSLKMTQCVSRVKATLPADATNETFTKALAADSEWGALDEQFKSCEASAKVTRQQAENLIRLRMQEETRAHQAVSEGKAKAIDGAAAPKTVEKK
jgi:hypothetical protein